MKWVMSIIAFSVSMAFSAFAHADSVSVINGHYRTGEAGQAIYVWAMLDFYGNTRGLHLVPNYVSMELDLDCKDLICTGTQYRDPINKFEAYILSPTSIRIHQDITGKDILLNFVN